MSRAHVMVPSAKLVVVMARPGDQEHVERVRACCLG
jgi:hypothetical protein